MAPAVVFAILRGGICILGRHFHMAESSEVGIFRFRGRSVVVVELRGGICISGRGFQVQGSWLGSSEGGLFGFRGRLVVFDELWGGTCTLGRRFHLFGSSEGGIFQVQRVPGCGCEIQGRSLHLGKSFFKSTGRLDGAAGFRGGIYSRPQGALSLQSSRAGIFSKWCHSRTSLKKNSPNLLNGRLTRTEPVVSRACSAGPGQVIPSDRDIPANRQNLETKV